MISVIDTLQAKKKLCWCRNLVQCVFKLARPIYVMIRFYLFILIFLFVFLLQTRTVTGPEYERNRMILETRRSYRRTKVRHNRLCRTHKITFHLPWFSYSSYAFSRVQSVQKKKFNAPIIQCDNVRQNVYRLGQASFWLDYCASASDCTQPI